MSMRYFPVGLSSLSNGLIDFDTDTMNAALLKLDGTATDVGVKAITGATNASPIVITSNNHGFQNGDIVVHRGIGGNTAANGTFRVASQTTNTYAIVTVKDGLNTTGNGAYTSGGCAIDLTLGDDFADIDAAVVSTPVALANKTVATAFGGLDADDVTFPPFTGDAHAWVIYEAAGKNLLFQDGRTQVVVAADAAGSATTLWIEKLEADLASGTQIVFSNGVTATLSAPATAGARSLSVNALSAGIAAGHQGDAAYTNGGLPLTAAGNGVAVPFNAQGIAALGP